MIIVINELQVQPARSLDGGREAIQSAMMMGRVGVELS